MNGELCDIILFYELFNKKGSFFEMMFGLLIELECLEGDVIVCIFVLCEYVVIYFVVGLDIEFVLD